MFSGKVVLITGSSSGVGAATAISFAKLGASVTITGRNLEKLKKIAKKCEEVSNKQPLLLVGDLSDEEFIKTLVNVTIARYKKLDILVNNAAIAGHGNILSTSLEQFDKLFKINVDAVFILTKLAVPYLIETKGAIVNVSSVAALRPFPDSLEYCMTKAVLDHFTRCLALELGGKQVRVNSVNPGYVDTDVASDASIEELNKHYKNIVPLGKIATTNEIAEAIVFLAGEESSYITGVNMPIDAGLTLKIPT